MRGIYAITNILTDTVYYGQAKNIKDRLRSHGCFLRNGSHDNPHLQHSFNKYGETAFVFAPIQIVEDTTIDLTSIEKGFIESAYSLGLKVFNIREPELKAPLSEESKARMSLARKGEKHNNYGKHLPLATRQKISNSLKGTRTRLGAKLSEETKQKISKAHMGKTYSQELLKKYSEVKMGNKNSFFGKHHTEETKRKISNTKKGIK